MTTKTICWLVYVVVSLICYIVSTALALKRKKATGMTKVDYDTFIKTEFDKVISYILKAEAKYKAVFKEGFKAGQFKLEDVLAKIKEDCADGSALFDKDFWTNIVDNIVACMNVDKQGSVQTENSVNVKGVKL